MSQLSEHFSLAEFTASEIAARKGIDNTMPPDFTASAVALCENVLEPARAILGPLRINSGYRCKALNAAVGGALKSQHVLGQAADVIPISSTVKLFELFEWIVKNAPFDQVIWEFGSWVHVSYAPERRGSILVASMVPGKKRAAYREITPEQLATLM